MTQIGSAILAVSAALVAVVVWWLAYRCEDWLRDDDERRGDDDGRNEW